MLEKNGFLMKERFEEDGVESCFYRCERRITSHA